MNRSPLLAASLLALSLIPLVATAALPQMRVVAGTRLPLPDDGEGTPQSLSLSIDGDSAVRSEDFDGDSLMFEIDGVPRMAMRAGDPAPDGDDTTIASLTSFKMSQARLLFTAKTADSRTLLLSHDGTKARSALKSWYPDIGLVDSFAIEATNANGDALLRRVASGYDTIGFSYVPNGDGGVGDPIVIVDQATNVPGVTAGQFELANEGLPAYLGDDGTVLFESAYFVGDESGFGVFYRKAGEPLSRIDVNFPEPIDGTEQCCDLFAVDERGHAFVVARQGENTLLFTGNPRSLSLAVTVPMGGLPIIGATGYRLRSLDIGAAHIAAGRGSLLWTTTIESDDPSIGHPWAVLAYEPSSGVRAIAIEGQPRPDGGVWGTNFTELVVGKPGRFQFTAADGVYRAERYNSDVTVARLAGPGDTFVDQDGNEVTAWRVGSSLDARSFAAGRTALTVYYNDLDDDSQNWMMLVDGKPRAASRNGGGGCRIGDDAPIGGFAALLLVVGALRRRRRIASAAGSLLGRSIVS